MTNLVVLGASGRTGRAVIAAALDRGLEPLAVVRASSSLLPARVQLVVENPSEGTTLTAAIRARVEGPVSIISCVGLPLRAHGYPQANSASAAMEVVGVVGGRLTAVSAEGAFGADNSAPMRAASRMLEVFFGEQWNDARLMEQRMGDIGGDNTAVRPPRLTGGGARGNYRSSERAERLRSSIRREDLASALLDVAVMPGPRPPVVRISR
jgi:putative NADH-flavin reductase